MAWTGFGGRDNSHSGFSSNGPNAAQNAANNANAGHYGNMFGGRDRSNNNSGHNGSDHSNNRNNNNRSRPNNNAAQQQAAAQAKAAEAARQAAAAEAARQAAAQQEAARQEAARQEAARQEAARQEAARKEAARKEAERQAQIAATKKAQEAERDKAINQLAPEVGLGERMWSGITSAFDSISNMFGGDDDDTRGTVGSTLENGAKWGINGFSMLGPVGGILGAIGGMIYGAGVTDSMTLGSLRGYNPNGLTGVTSAGDLAQRQGQFWNGNRQNNNNSRPTQTAQPRTQAPVTAPAQPKPVDKQAVAAINSLIPQSAKTMLEANDKASNGYLRALHGRYAKYLLSTGAQGSGTSLLGRMAGGEGALGGTSGRLLYSTGGNNG